MSIGTRWTVLTIIAWAIAIAAVSGDWVSLLIFGLIGLLAVDTP